MRDLTFVNANDLPPVPWKNGGGVTREIAQSGGAGGYAWRLSMADVATEGAFSSFPGLSRILTVIAGDGLELHGPDHADKVPFCQPYAFSGDAPIKSVLCDGAIRDFNVIYDAKIIDADVVVLRGSRQVEISPTADVTYAVFGVVGEFTCEGEAVQSGTFAQIDGDAVRMSVPNDSIVLLVRLLRRAS